MGSIKVVITLRDGTLQMEGDGEFVEKCLGSPDAVGRLMRTVADALESDNTRQKVLVGEGLNHAWEWFSLHATHRMQSVNFFLVAVAFLSAAFVTALRIPDPLIAAGVAALGVVISITFNRLEGRILELIHAGEAAIKPSQEHFAQVTGVREFQILEKVEIPRKRFTKYSAVINTLHWLSAAGFLAAAVYAWFWNAR